MYRIGIVALARRGAGVLLIAVDARTNSLIPLFTIGVFIGFTHQPDRTGPALVAGASGAVAAASRARTGPAR